MVWKALAGLALFGSYLAALPPGDAQCGGYGYVRSMLLYRDGTAMRVDPYIGGLNGVSPCGFWLRAEVRSPAGRTAQGEEVEGGNFAPSFASVSIWLSVGTDTGNYSASVQWKVEDDSVYPFQYYTPAPRSDWKATCSANGDDRERLIMEYPAYNVTPTPNCSDFTTQSGSQYFSFFELTGGYYAWAILRDALFAGLDLTRSRYGQALTVNSGYRSPSRNAAIPLASTTSRHMFGDAVDLNSNSANWQNICLAGRQAEACVEPRRVSGSDHVHLQWHQPCLEEWTRCPAQ